MPKASHNSMALGSFDVCLLITSTKAVLSVKIVMRLFDIWEPDTHRTKTMGKCSKMVIFNECQRSGHCP